MKGKEIKVPKHHGFTVTEAMIVVALLAIMATVATPSFVELVERNRVITTANSFLNALAIARSEAVKKNRRVAVCGKPVNQTACNSGANSGNWEQGWTVFVDADNDSNLDPGEQIILVDDGVTGRFTLREPSAIYNDTITFQATGETVQGLVAQAAGLGSQATFRLCTPDADTGRSRTINIRATGRAVITEGTTACP